jgi:hypothetical protein
VLVGWKGASEVGSRWRREFLEGSLGCQILDRVERLGSNPHATCNQFRTVSDKGNPTV